MRAGGQHSVGQLQTAPPPRGASGCFSPTKRGVDVDLCCLAPTSRVGEGELTAAFVRRMGHHGASVLTSSCSPCHGPAPLSSRD